MNVSELITLAIALLLRSCQSEPLVHSANLDPEGTFVMRWTPEPTHIVIEMEAATQGYMGIGFSPSGGMAGSDIIIAGIDEAGEPYLTDRHAIGQSSPLLDDSQDVVLLSAHRNSTHTTVRFRRAWDTCDKENDMALSGDSTRIIFAYNQDSTFEPRGENLPYHTKRGAKTLYLSEPRKARSYGTDVKHWDIRSPNVSLPDNVNTLYWCLMFKAPDFITARKSHFIGYTPLIPSDKTNYIHHLLIYECHLTNSGDVLEHWVGQGGAQCHSRNMPQSWKSCTRPIVIWAIGVDEVIYPPDVGFPIGEEWGGSTYFMMETHYDNPNLDSGVIDNSGIRLHYTHNLRKFDASVMTLGHSIDAFQIVPPRQTEWISTSLCSTGCTSKGLPLGGVNLFIGALHSHLLGRSITLQHIRNGVELEPILQDKHYDFNYQQLRMLKEERTILPGDQLITTCHYDSSARNKTTFGGESTQEEMCLSFLFYYPRTDFAECISRPEISGVLRAVGINEIYDEEKIVKNFRLPTFAALKRSGIVDVGAELKLREKLSSLEPGEEIVQQFAKFELYSFVAKRPEKYENSTLLNILEDSSTWDDPLTISKLQKLFQKGRYEAACKSTRGTTINVSNEDFPVYRPYKPADSGKCIARLPPTKCTKTNWIQRGIACWLFM